MKTLYTFFLSLFAVLCNAQSDSIIYPIAPQADIRDTIWGTEVRDPYRPLEVDNDERKEWIKQEEQITDNYFKKVKLKGALESDYEEISKAYFNIPKHMGPYYIEYVKNSFDGVDIYYKETLYSEDRKLLLSPRSVDKNLKTFNTTAVSPDGRYFAYSYSKNGSDWQEIGVYDIQNEKILKDHISNVRYTNKITWIKNGFYYFGFDSVNEVSKYLDASLNEKIYHHTIGSLTKDSLIYEDKGNPLSTFSLQAINERFLIITETEYNSNTTIIKFKDEAQNGAFSTINVKKGFHFSIIGSKADRLYARTTYPDAYNGSIVELSSNDLNHWTVVIANQKDFLIKEAVHIDEKFFIIYQQGFQQYFAVYNDSGVIIILNKDRITNKFDWENRTYLSTKS
jgi:prolyl oligopeptidase